MTRATAPFGIRLAAIAISFALLFAACAEESADSGLSPATTVASSGSETGGGDGAEAGAALFATTCMVCHGSEAQGVEGLGKPLAPSEFVQSMTDEELVAFIAVGRLPGDPDNTTGIAMPPKGGNPSLSPDDLVAIADWLRSIQ